MKLKQITKKDQLDLKEVYFDSISSIDENIYSKEHKFAWACQAWENSEFQKSLLKGLGSKLVLNNKIIGFAAFSGTGKTTLIKKIVALNSQPVEFGDHLIIFE